MEDKCRYSSWLLEYKWAGRAVSDISIIKAGVQSLDLFATKMCNINRWRKVFTINKAAALIFAHLILVVKIDVVERWSQDLKRWDEKKVLRQVNKWWRQEKWTEFFSQIRVSVEGIYQISYINDNNNWDRINMPGNHSFIITYFSKKI